MEWHQKSWAQPFHYLVGAMAMLLNIGLILTLFHPNVILAASSTWTTTADFLTWTRNDTQAASNNLLLAENSTTTENASTKAETMEQIMSRTSSVWATTTNRAYIFGGHAGNLSYFDDISEYDPITDTRTLKSSSFPQGIAYTTAVWDDTRDRAYIIGGQVNTGGTGTPVNTIYEYNPATDSLTTKSATLPQGRSWPQAAWNSVDGNVYIFGGAETPHAGNPSGHLNSILKYDPVADSITVQTATLPNARVVGGAVWDPTQQRIYILGGHQNMAPVITDQILSYNPVADSITIESEVIPNDSFGTVAGTRFASMRNPNNGLIYILGGEELDDDGDFTHSSNQIITYNPSTSTLTTRPVTLSQDNMDISGVWAQNINRAYVFGGLDQNGSNGGSYLDGIYEYDPGNPVYSSPGTATRIFTPQVGQIQDWDSASANTTLNNQTVSFQYTTNTNCSTGLTSNIASLTNSESLCIIATLSTTNNLITPLLHDLTVNYTPVTGGDDEDDDDDGGGGDGGGGDDGGSGDDGSGGGTTPGGSGQTTPTPTPKSTTTPTIVGSDTTPTPTPSGEPSPSVTASPTARPQTSGSVPSPTPSALPEESFFETLILGTPPGESVVIAGLSIFALGFPAYHLLINLVTWITNLPSLWLLYLSRGKKKYQWGRVYSSVTDKGVPLATVSLIDVNHYNRVIDRTVTLEDGTFGFLPKPGTYQMQVTKSGFSFPSRVKELGYKGATVTLDHPAEFKMDIPVDPQVTTFGEKLAYVLEILRIPLMILGSMIAISYVIYAVTVINLLFLAYYICLWAWELFRLRDTKQLLRVMDTKGNVVPFAVVKITNYKDELILSKATDSEGALLLVVPSGTYTLSITPPQSHHLEPYNEKHILNKSFFSRYITIHLFKQKH